MTSLAGFLAHDRDKVYFFHGSEYVRYDCTADKVDAGYPKPIAGNWAGAFDRDIDVAVLTPTADILYLFRGTEYVKIDFQNNTAFNGYPQPIAHNWPGLFDGHIDAALPSLDRASTYFFRGDQYVRFDWADNRVGDGYPRRIADFWPGVYPHSIDTAVLWPSGNAYFFAGSEYVQYDMKTDIPGQGYPLPVAGNWVGMPWYGATAPAARPTAVENPGGGRVTDKSDPAAADVVNMAGPGGAQVPLHRLAAQWWGELITAARADGHADPLLLPVSGYRSSAHQQTLFDAAVARYGSEEEARKWVAKPGGSAHQSGRAVDCHLGISNDSANVAAQRQTAVWQWLDTNAERFGFYPYTAEPWHWEYNPPA